MLIDKTKNGENVPRLEVVEVVLAQCNLTDNQYQQKSKVLNVEPSKLVLLMISQYYLRIKMVDN